MFIKNIVEAPKPTENPWKSRPAADLFNKENSEADAAPVINRSYTSNSNPSGNRSYNEERNRGNPKRSDQAPNRTFNSANKDRRSQPGGGERGTQRFQDSRGGGGGGGSAPRQSFQRSYPDKPNRAYENPNELSKEIEYNNKFAKLQVDVDEVE